MLPASSRPWDADKAIAIARRKVDDLTRDPRLRERLAVELEAWARKRWISGGDANRAT